MAAIQIVIRNVAGAALIALICFAHFVNTAETRGDEPAAVVSFDAANSAADATGQPADEPLLSFNFRFAPWPDVLKLFAETAGLTLDLKDTPAGTFSYFDAAKYTPTQALDVLNGYLLPRGYVLVRRNRFLVCLNTEQGIPPNVVPTVSPEELADRGDNELATVVFPLDDGAADHAASEVQQLLGPQGKAVALRSSNALLVTDVGSNLRLIDGLLKRGAGRRPAVSTNGTEFRAFPLEHISAREAERMVRDLFGLESRLGADPAAASQAGRSGPAIQLTAESRINSLLVKAPSHDVDLIEQLLEAADVGAPTGAGTTGAGQFRTAVEVVSLRGADAGRIGRALGSLSPRIRVSTTGGSSPPSAASQGGRPSRAAPPAPANGGPNTPLSAPPAENGQRGDPDGR